MVVDKVNECKKLALEINAFAKELYKHNVNVGWWDSLCEGDILLGKCILILTELAEGVEGSRKGKSDDKLPQYPMLWVEIADAFIRTLDIAQYLKCDITLTFYSKEAVEYNLDYEYNALMPSINAVIRICNRVEGLLKNPQGVKTGDHITQLQLSLIVAHLLAVADHYGFNLLQVAKEKQEFNTNRPDHTREARAEDGGKKI